MICTQSSTDEYTPEKTEYYGKKEQHTCEMKACFDYVTVCIRGLSGCFFGYISPFRAIGISVAWVVPGYGNVGDA